MSLKQLSVLSLSNIMLFAIGSGVMSLIALFAQTLGAEPSSIGFALAISFAAITVSTLSSSWLSNRFQTRKRFINIAAALSIPVAYMLGQSQSIFEMTLWLSVLWFLFGIISTMMNIITGLYADEKHRGKIFGIMGASVAISSFVGGMGAGFVVDNWGYPVLFVAVASIYSCLSVLTLLLDDKKIKRVDKVKTVRTTASHNTNMILLMLMAGNVFVASVSFMMHMARPMTMELQDFSATAISSTVAISGIVTFPLPFLMGWLSDKIGRRGALIVASVLPTIGVVIMLPANLLWHFWIAQSFLATGSVVGSLGSAYITDIVSPQQLSTSIARYNSTSWIGAVVGFTASGMAIQTFGLSTTMAFGVVLLMISLVLVNYATRRKVDKYATVLVDAIVASA